MANPDCTNWGLSSWYFVKEHLEGNSSDCIPATGCVGSTCYMDILFNGTGIDPSTGAAVYDIINELEIYNFSFWANDSVHNEEPHTAPDPIIDVTPPNMTANVTVLKTDGTQEEIHGTAVYAKGELVGVDITSYAWDGISGIMNNTVDYTIANEGGVVSTYVETVNGDPFCEWDYGFEPQPACVLVTETDPPLDYTDETIYIRYRIWAKDRAGNMNSSSDTGDWFYITTHALANFLTHNVHISLGQSYDLGVQVRNTQETYDTITLVLEDFESAYFLNTTGATVMNQSRVLKIGLNPHEERTVYVRVFSSQISDVPYTLNLTASSAETSYVDEDNANIYVKYPAAFPGLSEWAIAIIIILSVTAFYFKTNNNKKHFRHGGLS
jgi:hypothetical protein